MYRYLTEGDFQLKEKGIPVVTAGTGLGKTTFVVKGMLVRLLERQLGLTLDSTLILEANKATRRQIEAKGLELARDEHLMDMPQGRYVCCFSVLANLLANGNRPKLSGLVVVDEADELARWSLCHRGNAEAWNYLLAKHRTGEIFLVLLTATPTLLLKYTKGLGFYDATPDVPPRYLANNVEIVAHSSAKAVLRSLMIDNEHKAVVYTREASRTHKLKEELGTRGIKAVALHSEYNDKVDTKSGKTLARMMDEQLVTTERGLEPARDYVLETGKLPPDVQVLIINDALATGVTLEDESVKYVVVESTELETVLQVKGRMRQDVERLIVCYNKKEQTRIDVAVAEFNQVANGSLDARLEYQEKSIKAKQESSYLALRDVETGEAKLNPFAYATYQEQVDMLGSLFGDDSEITTRKYWHALLPHVREDFKFIDKESVLAAGRNRAKAEYFNLGTWLDRKLFATDKKELAGLLGLRTKKRERASWTTAKKTLQGLGYAVRDGKTHVDNKQVRYSVVSEPQG